MSEHIITREMLVSTLSDVMRERDAAKKDATQWHDDWVTLNQQRVQLLEERSRLERALTDEKARNSREMTVIQEELRIARKQACTCREGPFLSPNAGVAENMQLKELQQMVQSLQMNLIEVTNQRDLAREEVKKWHGDSVTANDRISTLLNERYDLKEKFNEQFEELSIAKGKTIPGLQSNLRLEEATVEKLRNSFKMQTDETMALHKALHLTEQQLKIRTTERDRFEESVAAADVQLKHERATRNEIRDQRDLLSKERDRLEQICQQVEQDLAAMRIERDSLKQEESNRITVLVDKAHSLDMALAEQMHENKLLDATCDTYATKWAKLRALFTNGMHSTETLQSNPPKNIIAWRGLHILESE